MTTPNNREPLPLDFDGPEPEDDVTLTPMEIAGAIAFVAVLLALGFLLGRVTV